MPLLAYIVTVWACSSTFGVLGAIAGCLIVGPVAAALTEAMLAVLASEAAEAEARTRHRPS